MTDEKHATDRAAATEIARRRLAEVRVVRGDEAMLVDDRTEERAGWWVFYYVSRRFAETNESRFALVGNGPLIVDKATGTSHFIDPHGPLDAFLQRFGAKLRARPTPAAGPPPPPAPPAKPPA